MTQPTDRVDSLSALFDPRSVVVVGASDDPSRIGGRLLRYLLEGGYTGAIHPVNARRATVQGLAAVPTVLDVDDEPEVALLAVPADATLPTLEQCAERGVKAAVILSAGFSETGAEGAAAERALVDYARDAGIRLLGPNCLGVLNSATGFYGTFANALGRGLPSPGPIGICSQSGAYGAHLLYLARRRGLGVTYWITTGNEADVDLCDALAWMALRDDVKVVAVYAEGIRDGARFVQALRLAHETRTAVVVMKVGASAAGAQAASSHTAALAGSDAVYDGVLAQFGALRARDVEGMLDIAYACARTKPPAGRRLGIVTVSGGAGVQACDAAERNGLSVPPLPGAWRAELLAKLPFASAMNPIDVTAQSMQDMELLATGLRLVLASGAFDSLLAFFTTSPLFPAFGEPLRQAVIAGTAQRGDEPFALCMFADPEMVADFEDAGFLVFEDIDRAVAALGALAQLGATWERELPDAGDDLPAVEPLPAAALSEHESKRRLAAAGVPLLPEQLVAGADEAVAAAAALGYPVALKLASPDVAHKSEIGGVALGLADEPAVRAAVAGILAGVAAHVPGARVDGLLVAPMAPAGVEMIVGTELDSAFGPLIMVGLGGIFAEVFEDVAFRVAPVDEAEARRMIAGLRAATLLGGVRGRPPADVGALARAVSLVSRFAAAHGPRLRSLDVNPLLVLADGEGVVALDAAIEGG